MPPGRAARVIHNDRAGHDEAYEQQAADLSHAARDA